MKQSCRICKIIATTHRWRLRDSNFRKQNCRICKIIATTHRWRLRDSNFRKQNCRICKIIATTHRWRLRDSNFRKQNCRICKIIATTHRWRLRDSNFRKQNCRICKIIATTHRWRLRDSNFRKQNCRICKIIGHTPWAVFLSGESIATECHSVGTYFDHPKGTTSTHSTGVLQMVLRKAKPTQITITSKITFDRIPADFLYKNQHLPKFGQPMRPGTRTRVPRRHCLHLRPSGPNVNGRNCKP